MELALFYEMLFTIIILFDKIMILGAKEVLILSACKSCKSCSENGFEMVFII